MSEKTSGVYTVGTRTRVGNQFHTEVIRRGEIVNIISPIMDPEEDQPPIEAKTTDE